MKGRILLLLMLGTGACAQTRPSEIPRGPDWMIVVKSARVPLSQPFLTHFAHHPWFELKKGSEDAWVRIDILETGWVAFREIPPEDVRHDTTGARDVKVWRIITGPEVPQMIADLERAAQDYPDDGNYRPFPGPNSNTFMARMTREVPGLYFPLDHNSVGKDYTPLVRIGPTTMKSGIAVDTFPLGFAVDAVEGIELHLLGLTFGLSIVRPALKLPFLPRLGAAW